MDVDLKAGIVRILNPDGTTAGTGFVVSDDGLIVTCAHVVWTKEAKKKGLPRSDVVAVVVHATGDRCSAAVEPAYWRDPDAEDVAILRLEGPLPESVTPLPLGSSADAEGRTFHTFGFPEAKPVEGMAGQCEVVGCTTEAGFPVLQLRSSEVSPGFSGAPVWDDDCGVVVGMVVSIAQEDRYGRQAETAFIFPVEMLRNVCPALQLPQGEPYRGLQVFEAEHADLYFGRDAATCDLLVALCRHDVVLLVGVSGSGKSSLVRAGLKKGLQAQPIPGLTERVRCLLVPGSEPLFNLVLTLSQSEGLAQDSVLDAFGLPVDALAEANRAATAHSLNGQSPRALAASLRACAPPQGLLLIVDQFERLYTECLDESSRDRFVETLLATAGDSVRVVSALRADFYGQALAQAGLEQVVRRGGQVTLGPMGEADLRTVVEEPARALRRSLQPGLAEQLVADVHGRAGDLPLLEFSLSELWARDNQQGVLTLATYEDLGYEAPDGQRFPGVQGAIAGRAEAAWQGLDEAERKVVRRVFLRLVAPGPVDERGEQMAEDASRRAWQAEWDEPTLLAVEKLVAARLLTTGHDPFSEQPTVEVAHEALIRAWPRLQRWLADHRPFVHWYDHDLAPFLRRWLSRSRDSDLLLPGAMLTQAEHWLARCPDELSGLPAMYIEASVQKREQERVARERGRLLLALASIGIAVIFLYLTSWALGERKLAEQEARVAFSRQLAAQAEVALEGHPQRSLLLAVEALSVTLEAGEPRVPAAENALRQALSSVGGTPLSGHEDTVDALAFSPDGRWLATGGMDTTVRLWNMNDLTVGATVLRGHENTVGAVVFSPGGHWLATGSGDGTTRLWDMTNPTAEPSVLHGHEGPVLTVAFSSDGHWLATGGWDNTVRLWDVSTPTAETTILRGHEKSVDAVAFSPDSRWLAAGSIDGTVLLWDMTNPTAEPSVLHGHEGGVTAVAFCPNGQWLATGGGDGTVRLWDMTSTATESAVLRGHGYVVLVLKFSPDGHWLAIGSEDSIIYLWDMTDPVAEPVMLRGHENGVGAVAFNSNGLLLATASWDGTARLWDTTDPRAESVALRGHEDGITAIAFSPDGQWLATGSLDGTTRLWGVTNLADLATLRGHDYMLFAPLRGLDRMAVTVAFGLDGRWLAMGSWDGTVRLWDMADPVAEPSMLHGHEDDVRAAAFSPDGRWLATGSEDGTARLWKVTDPVAEPFVLRGYQDHVVTAVAFSSDGRWLATGGWDATVQLWDLTKLTAEPVRLRGHGNSVETMMFSPDGHWLAIGSSWDRTIQLWDLTDLTAESILLAAHQIGVAVMAFSPDGRWLASGSSDMTVRLWNMTDLVIDPLVLRGHDYRVVAIAFSSDGRWLATGSSDGIVRLWDTTHLGTEPVMLYGHENTVDALAFTSDGHWLAAASSDGTVRFWRLQMRELLDLACSAAGRNLTYDEWWQYLGAEPYRLTCPNLPVPEE